MVPSAIWTVFVTAIIYFLLFTPCYSAAQMVNLASKKYKLLYFPHDRAGSHYTHISKSARALVRQGHHVTFLFSSLQPTWRQKTDADLFSSVAFNSQYTDTDLHEAIQEMPSKLLIEGRHRSCFIGSLLIDNIVYGNTRFYDMHTKQCDDLLGDMATIESLRMERFDMLVGDCVLFCLPLLAQTLDIPFVLSCNFPICPALHGPYGVPVDPSYIPEWSTGFSDTMTFIQRVQNVLSFTVFGVLTSALLAPYQHLKLKYNIKTEFSMFESMKQAKLWIFNGNYPLEFPRPMQPNMIFTNPDFESTENQTVDKDVAVFLDKAPAGVVIFSLGTYFKAMDHRKAQMFADAFALLPYRVLWQTNKDLSDITVANNTKVVKWVPLAKIMSNRNVKAIISHCGVNSVFEAIWAGLPVVGIPLFGDQFSNIDRVVARGFGVSLNFNQLTPKTLSDSIVTVASEPRFRERALHTSRILRDLTYAAPPAETEARWILHVIEFGGDHLRPAVLDLNFVQRNLLDVYLFILLVSVGVIGANLSFCYFCFIKKCIQNKKSNCKTD